MEYHARSDLLSGGDPILLSALLGFSFSLVLMGFSWGAIFIGLSSLIFHEIFKPEWEHISKGILMIVVAIPKSIVVGIWTPILRKEVFETTPNKRGVPEALSITLVPDSIVLMSDEMEHHIHRLVRK